LQGLPGEQDLHCVLTRTKFESLTSKLLARLLVPLREVALMAGVNLAGESLNTDADSIELTEMYSKEASAVLFNDVSSLKKRQQSGRQAAKQQKKIKASLGKELSRLKTEIGDNTLSAFPGGIVYY
jgi:molecular chaperone DnaK (HSP70)